MSQSSQNVNCFAIFLTVLLCEAPVDVKTFSPLNIAVGHSITMSIQFLSEVDLAARWAMSSKTLTRWRTIRRGPPFVKLGKTVRYAMSDVLEFERNGLRKPVLRLLPTPDDEQAPDQPVRLLTIRDVAAELRFGPEGDDGRRNCRK